MSNVDRASIMLLGDNGEWERLSGVALLRRLERQRIYVDTHASFGLDVGLFPYCKINSAEIGDHCEISRDARIKDGAKLGKHVYVGQGAIVGHGSSIPLGRVIPNWVTVGTDVTDILSYGYEPRRKYAATVQRFANGVVAYCAGCREFSFAEARLHWNPLVRDDAEACRFHQARIDIAEREARELGWI